MVSYEGDMSVNDVIEFLTTRGTHTNNLNRYKGEHILSFYFCFIYKYGYILL